MQLSHQCIELLLQLHMYIPSHFLTIGSSFSSPPSASGGRTRTTASFPDIPIDLQCLSHAIFHALCLLAPVNRLTISVIHSRISYTFPVSTQKLDSSQTTKRQVLFIFNSKSDQISSKVSKVIEEIPTHSQKKELNLCGPSTQTEIVAFCTQTRFGEFICMFDVAGRLIGYSQQNVTLIFACFY